MAQVLAYELASGTSPLDGTQTEAEVAAHLRDSYALAENFEQLKQRAALRRDWAQNRWVDGGGWMDGTGQWAQPGDVNDLDFYIEQEIDEELKAGRTLAARPSREEYEQHARSSFANGPMQSAERALSEGWNFSGDTLVEAQQARIEAKRRGA